MSVLTIITNVVADFDLEVNISKAFVLSSKQNGFVARIKKESRVLGEGWAFGYPESSGAKAQRLKERVLLEALKEAFNEALAKL